MKYLFNSIKVFVFLSLAVAGYYYFLFQSRIQMTIFNEGTSTSIGQLTALVAGEQKIIQNIHPNEKVLLKFNPQADWFAPLNASDLTLRYLVEGEKTEVIVTFPEIVAKKAYQFLISIQADGRYEITELKN